MRPDTRPIEHHVIPPPRRDTDEQAEAERPKAGVQTIRGGAVATTAQECPSSARITRPQASPASERRRATGRICTPDGLAGGWLAYHGGASISVRFQEKEHRGIGCKGLTHECGGRNRENSPDSDCRNVQMESAHPRRWFVGCRASIPEARMEMRTLWTGGNAEERDPASSRNDSAMTRTR